MWAQPNVELQLRVTDRLNAAVMRFMKVFLEHESVICIEENDNVYVDVNGCNTWVCVSLNQILSLAFTEQNRMDSVAQYIIRPVVETLPEFRTCVSITKNRHFYTPLKSETNKDFSIILDEVKKLKSKLPHEKEKKLVVWPEDQPIMSYLHGPDILKQVSDMLMDVILKQDEECVIIVNQCPSR